MLDLLEAEESGKGEKELYTHTIRLFCFPSVRDGYHDQNPQRDAP